ncbi:MAG: hypothetical protein IJH34_07530 [Romboutsia sp.]|nr:hypothetical protein [Romboutsia sp.]
MDREKLSKGNELIEQHERYDKLACMLGQYFYDEDAALIKDLIRVVKSYDEKVMKEFDNL